MNTNTGALYELGADVAPQITFPGDPLELEQLRAKASTLERKLTSDEAAAIEALEKGDRLVAIDAQVVQKLRLGERELRRRRHRR